MIIYLCLAVCWKQYLSFCEFSCIAIHESRASHPFRLVQGRGLLSSFLSWLCLSIFDTMHLCLPSVMVLGILSLADLGFSYAITTTILIDTYQFASTEAVYN